jgi:hypothetical protein
VVEYDGSRLPNSLATHAIVGILIAITTTKATTKEIVKERHVVTIAPMNIAGKMTTISVNRAVRPPSSSAVNNTSTPHCR